MVTDAQNNLLSGTYTYEKLFTYYNLENVVLNVTRENPPSLLSNNSYSFTMMGVSLDNWVNLVIQKDFHRYRSQIANYFVHPLPLENKSHFHQFVHHSKKTLDLYFD